MIALVNYVTIFANIIYCNIPTEISNVWSQNRNKKIRIKVPSNVLDYVLLISVKFVVF